MARPIAPSPALEQPGVLVGRQTQMRCGAQVLAPRGPYHRHVHNAAGRRHSGRWKQPKLKKTTTNLPKDEREQTGLSSFPATRMVIRTLMWAPNQTLLQHTATAWRLTPSRQPVPRAPALFTNLSLVLSMTPSLTRLVPGPRARPVALVLALSLAPALALALALALDLDLDLDLDLPLPSVRVGVPVERCKHVQKR